MLDQPSCIFRDANTGVSQDFTGLAVAVQLRFRVAFFFRVASIPSDAMVS